MLICKECKKEITFIGFNSKKTQRKLDKNGLTFGEEKVLENFSNCWYKCGCSKRETALNSEWIEI